MYAQCLQTFIRSCELCIVMEICWINQFNSVTCDVNMLGLLKALIDPMDICVFLSVWIFVFYCSSFWSFLGRNVIWWNPVLSSFLKLIINIKELYLQTFWRYIEAWHGWFQRLAEATISPLNSNSVTKFENRHKKSNQVRKIQIVEFWSYIFEH